MSDQITTAQVKQFGNQVDLLAQQEGTVLRATIGREIRVVGKQAFIDQIKATKAQRTNSRHADSPLVNTPHARRRLSMINVEWGDLIDDFDMVRTLIDPTNPYTQNAAWAVGRELDDIVIEKYFADANTGEEGSTTTSFPAGNQISADFDGDGTSEGMTVEKLREARKLLMANNVMPGRMPWFVVVTAEQLDDLLATTEVTSADFNTVRALVDGNVTSFLGFNFVHTERLDTDSSSDRRCPAYAADGMALGVGMEPRARITERADKRFNTYVFYSMVAGATRIEEEKVMEIKCAE